MPQRSPTVDRLPTELYVEPTNRCNSKCRTCVRTFRTLEPPRDMSLTEFVHIIDQFPVIERVTLHGIGEPLLNVDLAEMIRYVKGKHPAAAVLFNSNGISLTGNCRRTLIESGLDEYRVSLDAATAQTYSLIRGMDAFEYVKENIRRLIYEAGPESLPRVSLWLVAVRDNVAELPALVDLAAELGVPEVYVQRLVLFDAGFARPEKSVYRNLQGREEQALNQASRRAEELGITLRASGLTSPDESLRGPGEDVQPWADCRRPWATTYITANGNVLPCCISPFSAKIYTDLLLGNVFDTPFRQIWNNPKYVERRERQHTPDPMHPCELCGLNWSL